MTAVPSRPSHQAGELGQLALTNAGHKSAADSAEQRPPLSTVENEAGQPGLTGAFAAFDRWLEDYVATTSDSDAKALEPEGEALASQRRSALAKLIVSDPARAIRLAVPNRIRQELPASIVQHLEERVSGLARFDVIAVLPTPGKWNQTPRLNASLP